MKKQSEASPVKDNEKRSQARLKTFAKMAARESVSVKSYYSALRSYHTAK